MLAAVAASGKAATHASVASSPEPFSNIALSLAEDATAVFLVWFATAHPVLAALIAITLATVDRAAGQDRVARGAADHSARARLKVARLISP